TDAWGRFSCKGRGYKGSIELVIISQLPHRRALHIRPNSRWTSISLLKISERDIEIEKADAADDRPPNARLLRDMADDVRCGMQHGVILCSPRSSPRSLCAQDSPDRRSYAPPR